MILRACAWAFCLLLPSVALAQAPEQTAAVPLTPAVIPVGSRVGILPSGYEDGGRRDPFGALVTPKRSANPSSIDAARPRTGLQSLALADARVTGISKVGDTRLAILAGPNKQSYVSRVGDRLFDAVVHSIDADGVVFSEQFPGSSATTQVRRALRPAGEDIQ